MAAILPIHPIYLDLIFDGQKTIELRTRTVNLDPGTLIWLYATSPRTQIEGYAYVERVVTGSPTHIWNTYGRHSGISRAEFREYFSERRFATAIQLRSAQRIETPLALADIRDVIDDFHPPQFYCKLLPDTGLGELLQTYAAPCLQ